MSRLTNFLKLFLPEDNEYYNVEKDQNENFEKIDGEFKKNDEEIKNIKTKYLPRGNISGTYSKTAYDLKLDIDSKAPKYGGEAFVGFSFGSDDKMYVYKSPGNYFKLLDNRDLSSNINDSDANKIASTTLTYHLDKNKVSLYKTNAWFAGLHFNGSDLYYSKTGNDYFKFITNVGGNVDNLTINGNKIFHNGNLIRQVWGGAWVPGHNATIFCNLPSDWRICFIVFNWSAEATKNYTLTILREFVNQGVSNYVVPGGWVPGYGKELGQAHINIDSSGAVRANNQVSGNDTTIYGVYVM